MITERDARRAVRRLRDVFNTPKSEDKQVQAVMVVFDDEPVTGVDLMAATTWFLKSDSSYMPTPGKLLRKAKELLGSKPTSAARELSGYSDHDAPCAVCGAVPRWLEPEEQVHYAWNETAGRFENQAAEVTHGKRYGVVHKLAEHRRAGVECVGYWR